MELLKKVATILLTGAVGLGVIVAAISWFQMSAEDRAGVYSGVGKSLAWIGIVLILPWATFFITKWVAKWENNISGAILVGAYTILDFVLLMWLFNFGIHGTTAIVLVAFGILTAMAYNLLVCDWIAEKM